MTNRVKLKILSPVDRGSGHVLKPGDQFAFPHDEAQQLIQVGAAVPIEVRQTASVHLGFEIGKNRAHVCFPAATKELPTTEPFREWRPAPDFPPRATSLIPQHGHAPGTLLMSPQYVEENGGYQVRQRAGVRRGPTKNASE